MHLYVAQLTHEHEREPVHHHLASSAAAWTSVRDELRERRQTRTERRSLERELSAYSTPAEIDDLLAVIETEDSPPPTRCARSWPEPPARFLS